MTGLGSDFLRNQLALYRERPVKPRRASAPVRLALVLLARGFAWREALTIVQPATLLRWHRQAFRLLWRWRSRSGRPRLPADLPRLISAMARSNPTWGEERIAAKHRGGNQYQSNPVALGCREGSWPELALPPQSELELIRTDLGWTNQWGQARMSSKNAQPFPLFPILFVTAVFYWTFVSRIIMGPLLPVIEKEMGWGHGQAGSIFLYIAVGYGVGLLFAGSVSSRLTHHRTLALSSALVGAALIALSRSSTVIGMRLELLLLGLPAGWYLPSGVAVLTDLASPENWGRTMAIHELGPNVGYITAPLIAEGLLQVFPWRGALAALGVLSVLTGLLFLLLGRGGEGKGEPPRWEMMRGILSTPTLWILIAFFTISIGASVGVYSMMPLFLVSEAGFERGWANTFIAISRISATILLFGAGLLTDRFGPKKAMTFYLSMTGLFTLALGFFHDSPWILPIFFLQATAGASLFPIGYTILSLTFPSPRRSSAVSLNFFFAFLLGGGLTPTAIGYWAEAFSFSSALMLLGIFFLGLLPLFLRMGSKLNLSG